MLVSLLIATALASGVQKEGSSARAPRKGDAIVVRGCLAGGALEATDLGSAERTTPLLSGLTFRLTGDKARLKQLKDEHNGKVVEIDGVLKSDLPKESGASRNLGKMRITIGAPTDPAMSREAETRRSFPVLEVKSYTGGSVTCGR